MKKNKLPTGYLFSAEYEHGELETLSIGDYGKENNIKADFLGYTKEINGVPNMATKPLSEKWVMTLSTQYGCPMKCRFCDVPKIKYKGNASKDDLEAQLLNARKCFPEVRYTERLNIHFARMGEPMYNFANIFNFCNDLITKKYQYQIALDLRVEVVHPVFTTMMPKLIDKEKMLDRLITWCGMKNDLYHGQAGLQLSINSTEDKERDEMFCGESLSLREIAELALQFPFPISRKYCLNFALASGLTIDGEKLAKMFSTDKIMCKITPIHNNIACRENKIETVNGYENFTPYREAEKSLLNAGFDVITFVPSMDEEKGLVTCGNLALSGSKVTCGEQ